MKILISFLALLFSANLVQGQETAPSCFLNKICLGNHFEGPTGNVGGGDGDSVSANDPELACNPILEPFLIQHIGNPDQAIGVDLIFPDFDLTVPFSTHGVLDANGDADNTEILNPSIFLGEEENWASNCARNRTFGTTQTIEVCLDFGDNISGLGCDFRPDEAIQGGRFIESNSENTFCYEVDLYFCCDDRFDPLPHGEGDGDVGDFGKISNNTGNQQTLGLTNSNEEVNNLNQSLNSRSIESEITVYPNPVSDILYINGHYNNLTIKNVNNQIIYNLSLIHI